MIILTIFIVLVFTACRIRQLINTNETKRTREQLLHHLQRYHFSPPPYSLVRALKFVGVDLGLDI